MKLYPSVRMEVFIAWRGYRLAARLKIVGLEWPICMEIN